MAPEDAIRFVIITGLSGAGKSHALKTLEDLGFFCVDNLPPSLLPAFAELAGHARQRMPRVALGVDVREGEYLPGLGPALAELRARGHAVDVVFLDASDEALVRRFHETRRRHPLAERGGLREAFRLERAALAELRALADRVIDTSALTIHQLRERLAAAFPAGADGRRLAPALVSFGFKHGVPTEADLVFDVRFLPNPHFAPELRPLDGRDPAVRSFVLDGPPGRELLGHLDGLLGFLLPAYEREGKSYLTIAVGCTGGRHRAVAVAEVLAERLRAAGHAATLTHRDVDRE